LDGIARENLRITDVKVTLLSCRLPEGKHWFGSYPDWKTDAVLVQVFTDKGIVGIGESCPYAGPESLRSSLRRPSGPS
jgi:hypothetical protein